MRLVLPVVCVLAGLAGCGGDPPSSAAGPTTTTMAPAAAPAAPAPAAAPAAGAPAASTPRPRAQPGVRMTMEALHKAGGVPAGWQLSPPPGDVATGRQLFADYGCSSCHKVAGEPWSPEAGKEGPELTGMGGHHPPGYFAEAILNPDAVITEGPGYTDADGRSVMPSYPDMTIVQLADIVAYVASLTATPNGMPPGHCEAMAAAAAAKEKGATPDAAPAAAPTAPAPAPAAPAAPAAASTTTLPPRAFALPEIPPAAPAAAKAWFVQSYDVLAGKAPEFVAWFEREGARRFLAVPGLVGVDTYVDLTRTPPGPYVTSVFAFKDAPSLNAFLATHDPEQIAVGTEFDGFVGTHDHRVYMRPPIYRAPGLSVP